MMHSMLVHLSDDRADSKEAWRDVGGRGGRSAKDLSYAVQPDIHFCACCKMRRGLLIGIPISFCNV